MLSFSISSFRFSIRRESLLLDLCFQTLSIFVVYSASLRFAKVRFSQSVSYYQVVSKQLRLYALVAVSLLDFRCSRRELNHSVPKRRKRAVRTLSGPTCKNSSTLPCSVFVRSNGFSLVGSFVALKRPASYIFVFVQAEEMHAYQDTIHRYTGYGVAGC